MTRLFLLLWPLLAALAAPAQPLPPADPLAYHHRALARATTDSARGRHLWALSEFSDSDDSTIYFAQRAIPLLERILPGATGTERRRLLCLLGSAVNNLGVGYSDNIENAKVERLYLRAARLRGAGGDVRGQVESLINVARLRNKQNDYAGALRYYQQAVRAGQGVPDARSQLAEALSDIGSLYGSLGDEPAQLQYQLRALALLEKNGEPQSLLEILDDIAETYFNYLDDTVRAEAYARKAQLLAGKTPSAASSAARSLVLRGEIRLRQGRLSQARAFLLEASRLEPNKTSARQVGIQYLLAEVEEGAGNLPLALRYALSAVAPSQHSSMVGRLNAEKFLSHLYERLGQPQAALTHYRRYVALRDNERNEQNQKLALQQRLRAEYGQREAALKAAQDKRQAVAAAEIRRQKQLRTAITGGAGLLLLLAGGLYYAFRRSERLKQLVTNQKQGLQLQRDRLDASLTELRAAQARLVQQEKMASLGALTAGIAHEIQNPLNFVNNFAEVSTELVDELAEERAKGPAADSDLEAELLADLQQNLGKIHQHGQRAASIVRGMLEHSRHRSGEHAPTDLNHLAEEYLRLAYQGLRAKDKTFNARLDTDFAPGLPPVPAVGADVGRVLLNLLNNAFYAVRQRQQAGAEAGYAPVVSVRTRRVNDQVEIHVSDNGPGMPAAVQAKLFEPFFTTKPAGEGTGLGLSLAHDIIAQGHGGTLTVESTEGEGTTFTVGLPLNGVAR